MLSRTTVRVAEVARDYSKLNNINIYMNITKILGLLLNQNLFIYMKESSVCWYDGLGCKLND